MLFRAGVLSTALSLVSLGQAQKYYDIDPESVDKNIRDQWCVNQESSCPLICSQTDDSKPLANDCDAETLQYGCLCGDNTKPNMSEYSLTIPYFVCREWGTQCVADCDDTDTPCQSACRQDNPCGAQDPKRVNVSETSTTMDATASKTDDGQILYTGSSDDNGGSGGSGGNGNGDSAAAMLRLGDQYGMLLVLGSMGLGFAML